MHVPLIRPTDAELAPLAVPGYNGDIAYKKRLRLYGFAVQRVFEMAVKRQLAGVASPPITRAVNRTKAVLSAGIEGECISTLLTPAPAPSPSPSLAQKAANSIGAMGNKVMSILNHRTVKAALGSEAPTPKARGGGLSSGGGGKLSPSAAPRRVGGKAKAKGGGGAAAKAKGSGGAAAAEPQFMGIEMESLGA